jgi:hypothetical protein
MFDDMRMAPIPADVDADLFERERGTGDEDNRGWSPIVSGCSLRGYRVHNGAGEELGSIEDVAIDERFGRIAYAVLSFGGVLGIGSKLFAVPWAALTFDRDNREAVLDIDRGSLEQAEGFNREHWPAAPDETFLHPAASGSR